MTQIISIITGNVYSACRDTVFIEDTAVQGIGSLLAASAGSLFGYGANKIVTGMCKRASKLLEFSDNSSQDDAERSSRNLILS